MEDLKAFIISFINGIGIKNPDLNVSDLKEFFNGYRQNPARDGIGATRYNSLLWLFTFCRYLNPEVVVESGVYIGRSLWTLRILYLYVRGLIDKIAVLPNLEKYTGHKDKLSNAREHMKTGTGSSLPILAG